MKTVQLSHPRATTNVPDPIHGNISLTCYEREIVDSEHFQRLHFILQNSTSYVAFPSNKNSRFAHSLGVMHLSGELFVNALKNSSLTDLDDFLENASILVNEIALKASGSKPDDLRNAWKDSIAGQSRFRHAPSIRQAETHQNGVTNWKPMQSRNLHTDYPQHQKDFAKDRKFTAGFLVDTLWQAVRLCGLVHDIGHLPMSHSLEGALDLFTEQRAKENKVDLSRLNIETILNEITTERAYEVAIAEFGSILEFAYPSDVDQVRLKEAFKNVPAHEKRSVFILYELLTKGIYDFQYPYSKYRAIIFNIAFIILFSSIRSDQIGAFPPNKAGFQRDVVQNSAFRFLKLIVAGSVDGDRMDYTVRDGHSCGSTIGSFDIDQVLAGSTLFRDRISKEFKMGFFYRSLPAIEDFFVQRYQGYKYLIYHRTSSRTEVCLQHAVANILTYCDRYRDDPISTRFEELGYISYGANGDYKIFPVFLEAELDEKRGSGHGVNVPNIDDANLRSFLQWTLLEIESGKHAAKDPKRSLMESIELLLKIVLKRDYAHIYDPFKDGSVTHRAKSAIKKVLPEFLEDASNYTLLRETIVTNRSTRKECISHFKNTLDSMLPRGCLAIVSEQVPKIYEPKRAISKGEEIYLTYASADDKGFINVQPITRVSSTIANMQDLFVKEFRINLYFVFRNVKLNSEIREKIEAAVDNALQEAVTKAINQLPEERVKLPSANE